jgi:hypothetical protein
VHPKRFIDDFSAEGTHVVLAEGHVWKPFRDHVEVALKPHHLGVRFEELAYGRHLAHNPDESRAGGHRAGKALFKECQGGIDCGTRPVARDERAVVDGRLEVDAFLSSQCLEVCVPDVASRFKKAFVAGPQSIAEKRNRYAQAALIGVVERRQVRIRGNGRTSNADLERDRAGRA